MRNGSFRGPSPLGRVINMRNKLFLKVIEAECEWIQSTTLFLLDETNRNSKRGGEGARPRLKDRRVPGSWLQASGRQATPNPPQQQLYRCQPKKGTVFLRSSCSSSRAIICHSFYFQPPPPSLWLRRRSEEKGWDAAAVWNPCSASTGLKATATQFM